MRINGAGPSGLPTGPAPDAVSGFPSYPVPDNPQEPAKASAAERLLVAAGWAWPSQLACEADRLGLLDRNFDDRLCGVTVGYLRECGESGRTPRLAVAESVLDAFSIGRAPDELCFLLLDTQVPRDCDFADLVGDVLRASEQRSAQQCREQTRDALITVNHAFSCPRCIACANGARPTTRPGLRGRAVA